MTQQRAEKPAFGALLREHRIAAGLSQEALAERARISVQAISALERGARSAPRADTLTLLIESLGLSDELRADFEATARSSAKARVRTGPRHVPARAPRRPLQMPRFATQFIGREHERREIRASVAGGNCITLWGAGGVGKTRLAIDTVDAVIGDFEGDAVFVSLAATIDDDGVVPAVASALGIEERPDTILLDEIVDALENRRILLVLDNCEHVTRGAALVAESVLARDSRVAVLCTSREPLRIGAERIYPIKPFDQLDASKLFLNRATATFATREPTQNERHSIEDICRRLDGVALAIELAAACSRSLDVATIAQALDERFRLLTRGSRAVGERHLSLRATIAWSYDLLEVTVRRVFERLAILNGRFTIADAIAVAADESCDRHAVVASLADLVEKSLVTVEGVTEPDRRAYRLLESTRAFAATLPDELRSDHNLAASYRRLGADLFERVDRGNIASRSDDDSQLRAIDVDVVRGYLTWAIANRGDVAHGAWLSGKLYIFWHVWGLHLEGIRWIQSSLAALPLANTDLQPPFHATFGIGRLYQRIDLFAESKPFLEQAFQYALAFGDEALVAAASHFLSLTCMVSSEYEAAGQRMDQALAIYDRLGNRLARANALPIAVAIDYKLGHPAAARERAAQAIEISRAMGLRRNVGYVFHYVAEAEYALGNTAIAVTNAENALAIHREFQVPLQIAALLTNLTTYNFDLDRIDEAAIYARELVDIVRAGPHRPFFGRTLTSCAIVAVSRNRHALAAAELFGYAERDKEEGLGQFAHTEGRAHERLGSLLEAALTHSAREEAMQRGRELDDEAAMAAAESCLD